MDEHKEEVAGTEVEETKVEAPAGEEKVAPVEEEGVEKEIEGE